MGVAGGPKISKDGLVFAIDSDSNVRGFTKYGTSGTNNNHRAIRNLVDRSSTFSTANTSQLTGGVTYYTLYGITYPESNYSPANRDGVTPGFENTTAAMTYGASMDLNYYVFDEDTNTWVVDSYFNGERISGHCYDTYYVRPSQHATFQADYDNIKNTFPNATHIVIGSHASENVDNDANTVTRLKEIGFPDDAVGLGRAEFVLAGKVNKPWTHHYVRENVSSAVANMVIGLPLEGKGGALTFDGTDDHISLDSNLRPVNGIGSIEAIIKPTSNNAGGIVGWGDGSTSNWGGFDTGNRTSGFNDEVLAFINLSSGAEDLVFFGRDSGGTNQLNDGNYHHVVVVVDGIENTIYLDGEKMSTISFTYGSATSTFFMDMTTLNKLRVGNSTYNNGHIPFTGEIPVTRIYNRGLSADEVQQNYNAYKNRFNL